MKGRCKCKRVLKFKKVSDVINCGCGAIIVMCNGKWKLYEAKK